MLMKVSDEGVIVSIPSGPPFGCLKDGVERFDPGIMVVRNPTGKNGLAMLLHGAQRFADWLEHLGLSLEGLGDMQEIGQAPFGTS